MKQKFSYCRTIFYLILAMIIYYMPGAHIVLTHKAQTLFVQKFIKK